MIALTNVIEGESEEMIERRILNSWKEIANYLGRGVRTVQRWEAHLGLPVHRPAGRDHSAVLAFSNELDQWLDSRPVRQATPLAADGSSAAPLEELRALLSRAEILLEKLESVLSRSDEMHRRLSLAVDALSTSALAQDLQAADGVQSARAEAA